MNKKIVGGLVVLIVLLSSIGCYLLTQRNTDTEPEVVLGEETKQLLKDKEKQPTAQDAVKPSPPGKTKESGHRHKEPHAEVENGTPPEVVPTENTDSPLPPLPPSSVPEDIPEHLKLLPEMVNEYYYDFEDEPPAFEPPLEVAERFINILKEIIQDYNPQRPLAEVWPQYIAYEKMYRARAEYDLGYTPLGGSCYNRTDWAYEQTWAFPEIMGLVLKDDLTPEEGDRFLTIRMIEMGEESPDWNLHILRDGREFRVKGDYRYEFKYGTSDAGSVIGFSRTLDKNAPLIVIDVANTSDAELKRLGGWNYNINPYTLQPVQYERYNIKNKWDRK